MQVALSESEAFLDTWTLVMGFVFVVVVLFMPKGLAGAAEALFNRLVPPPGGDKRTRRRRALSRGGITSETGPAE
jgi:urea transport system permease protein